MSYIDQITVGSTTYDIKDSNAIADVQAYGTSVVSNGVAALPDTIHIGTAAPSDPNVKIWLDTDEQGQSVVTSVNGQTGAVTVVSSVNGQSGAVTAVTSINGQSGAVSLHPLFDLLWTNASPTSNFSAQTLSIDLSNYSFLIVRSVRSTSSTDQSALSIVEVGGGDTVVLGGGAAGVTLTARNVNAVSTGINFSMGYLNGNSGTSDAWGIPVKIYGVRGTLV